jgi:VanZ family protein
LGLLITGSIEEIKPEANLLLKCSVAILFGVFFGAIDEIHQYFVPMRQCCIFDLLADFLGIFLFVSIFCILKKLKIFNRI